VASWTRAILRGNGGPAYWTMGLYGQESVRALNGSAHDRFFCALKRLWLLLVVLTLRVGF
jgi:hypothetical protein